MSRNIQTLIVIPAYNEEKMIEKVVKEVRNYVDEVIVVNDSSTDQTAIVAHEAGATVISHPINLGQGAALQTGFDYAKRIRPQVTITYDADGQFSGTEIPQVVQPILDGKADIVLGSRFLGQTKNAPHGRQIILKLGILFTKVFSDLSLTDVHNGFRALSLQALDQIELKHNRMAHASEILDQIGTLGLKYMEVPVTVKYTKYSLNKGQSNLNSLSIISDLILSRIS